MRASGATAAKTKQKTLNHRFPSHAASFFVLFRILPKKIKSRHSRWQRWRQREWGGGDRDRVWQWQWPRGRLRLRPRGWLWLWEDRRLRGLCCGDLQRQGEGEPYGGDVGFRTGVGGGGHAEWSVRGALGKRRERFMCGESRALRTTRSNRSHLKCLHIFGAFDKMRYIGHEFNEGSLLFGPEKPSSGLLP